MPVTPIFSEVIPNSTVNMTVTPDAPDVNDPDTLFTNTGTEAFTETDIRVTRDGAVVDAVRDFTLDLKGTTEATFGVHLPLQVGDYEVRIVHDRVHGVANDLLAYVRVSQGEYLWTDQATIQSYLDGNGTIQIRDNDVTQVNDVVKNFSQAAARRLENESVFEVATLLSMVFSPVGAADGVDTNVYSVTPLGFRTAVNIGNAARECPLYLSLLVAKLAASKIATVRLGASLSTLPNWVRAYKNEVYAQLQRWAVNAETAAIAGLSVRTGYDIADVLIKMKTREHTAEALEN